MNKISCLLVLLALSACGTSPDPDYFTLTSVGGQTMQTAPVTVKLRRPGIGATIDRPEMVGIRGNSVVQDDLNLWSESLDRMIERVLAEDLSARLPSAAVITESGGMVVDPDYLVDMEIQQFGSDGQGRAVLAAVVSVHAGDVARAPQRIVLNGGPIGSGGAMAAELSSLLGKLADKIAAGIPGGA